MPPSVVTNIRRRNAGTFRPQKRTVPYAGMSRIRFDGLAHVPLSPATGHPNGYVPELTPIGGCGKGVARFSPRKEERIAARRVTVSSPKLTDGNALPPSSPLPPAHQPPVLSPAETAFFLDVDGTLAEIVSDPAQARVSPDVCATLAALRDAAGGALALVSGRSIEQLDGMLRPLVLPLAGVHGLERRDINGRITRMEVDTAAHKRLVTTVDAFTQTRPGLQAEEKPGSVALHFRNRPELAAECVAFMQEQRADDSRLALVEGKMVAELKFGTRDKRQAIADFMAEPPFQGRRPFFAGDDITDEAGFAGVNAAGGVSVKIGGGDSAARFRLANPTALAVWLAGLTAGNP